MAVKDGLPATDFSRQNREWVKAVAGGGSGGGGIPAPANPSDGDVLTYSSADDEWIAVAPSGGELDSVFFYVKLEDNPDYATDPSWTTRTVATAKEILDAMDAGKILIGDPGDYFNCGDAGSNKYFLMKTNITPDPPGSVLSITALHFEYVDAADIATAHFIMDDNSLYEEWTVAMTPVE